MGKDSVDYFFNRSVNCYFNWLALRNFMADRLVELCMENSLRAIGDPVDEAPARLLYDISRKI